MRDWFERPHRALVGEASSVLERSWNGPGPRVNREGRLYCLQSRKKVRIKHILTDARCRLDQSRPLEVRQVNTFCLDRILFHAAAHKIDMRLHGSARLFGPARADRLAQRAVLQQQ